MSTPKNHHYITQAHIRNFFNKEDKCIYLYDKKSKRFFTKNTSKSIFSEKNLKYEKKCNWKLRLFLNRDRVKSIF